MQITGRIRQMQIFGPSLELRRTISGTLGQPLLRIRDEVINRGNTPAPHMLLYHFNFGWPLVDEGTDLIWQGATVSRDGDPENRIFRPGHNYRQVPAPMPEHLGSGEDAAIIDIAADAAGQCTCGLHNARLGLALALIFLILLLLAPGESRHYEREIEVLHSPAAIQEFLTHTLQINQKVNV